MPRQRRDIRVPAKFADSDVFAQTTGPSAGRTRLTLTLKRKERTAEAPARSKRLTLRVPAGALAGGARQKEQEEQEPPCHVLDPAASSARLPSDGRAMDGPRRSRL